MRQRVFACLCALALASCVSATPTIDLPASSPSLAATRAPNLLPVGFSPPDACPRTTLDVVGAVTRWTFYCRFQLARTPDLAAMIREQAVAQGWRECAPLRFTKDDLAMAIQLAPTQGGFVLAQWERTTVC